MPILMTMVNTSIVLKIPSNSQEIGVLLRRPTSLCDFLEYKSFMIKQPTHFTTLNSLSDLKGLNISS